MRAFVCSLLLTTMVSINDLPPEVITRSFQFSATNKTLKSCCLVDTSMRAIAQPLLVCSLLVDPDFLWQNSYLSL
ncbi:hypothetical protein DL96DRAFT_1608698, partial [Flagelloscypha sp. PMI_526]